MRLLAALCAAVSLLMVGSASADNYLYWHWPRQVAGGKAEIAVTIDTATDPGYAPFVQQAISEWNASGDVHLTLTAPASCAIGTTWPHTICVTSTTDPSKWQWGWAGILTDPIYGHLISYGSVTFNSARIGPADGWDAWDGLYTACHELGEAMGLPDPSDDPVTPTPLPTCLTRDTSVWTNAPSAFEFGELDSLYSFTGADPAYSPFCSARNKTTGKCPKPKIISTG